MEIKKYGLPKKLACPRCRHETVFIPKKKVTLRLERDLYPRYKACGEAVFTCAGCGYKTTFSLVGRYDAPEEFDKDVEIMQHNLKKPYDIRPYWKNYVNLDMWSKISFAVIYLENHEEKEISKEKIRQIILYLSKRPDNCSEWECKRFEQSITEMVAMEYLTFKTKDGVSTYHTSDSHWSQLHRTYQNISELIYDN